MQCLKREHVQYRVGDVVLLDCSVNYSGNIAPTLTWTDGGGNSFDLEAVHAVTASNVS